MSVFTCAGASAPKSRIVSGSTVYLFPKRPPLSENFLEVLSSKGEPGHGLGLKESVSYSGSFHMVL